MKSSGRISVSHNAVCIHINTEHTTPLLHELYWLKVPERIQYRLCVLAFRCLHGLAPSYLSETLHNIHRSGRSLPTQIREYVNTRRTIHSSIHSRRPSVPCGCCTCLEFLATQCSVYVVAGFLLSASKDSPVRCIISSLTLNAILEISFCTVPLQRFLWQRH